jgi:hypothetical protein
MPSKAKDLAWKIGIPPRVRAKVWCLALGNQLMITPELFEIFGQNAKLAREKRLKFASFFFLFPLPFVCFSVSSLCFRFHCS